ncbi:Glucose/ribitol dehydrogenase [Penicillium occitanis (nom. inval.)]|nr:Glucose/ribitol dehydrogenase [Penicillium occitanis (nom. inval.)]PCH09756.1 hypothetical protein PENOC_007680 [Penicillium occitanis (nom. inval.)]
MMAHALAENGAARVYIIGRREDRLIEAASKYPNIIVPLQGDITQQDTLKQIAERVKQEVGYINLLVTNAGITGPGLEKMKPRATLADFVDHAWSSSMSDFNSVYDLNCTAVYYCILAFLVLLDEGNKRNTYLKSQVIATASSASFLRNPRAGFAYCSSKAALVSMIKCFSTFCVPWGIRFNALAAGLIPSELSAPLLNPFKLHKEKPVTEVGAFSRSYQPAERAGGEQDIAGVILYLASKAGDFVNGSVLLVDGGKIATMPATY